jgi:hypothetical protein
LYSQSSQGISHAQGYMLAYKARASAHNSAAVEHERLKASDSINAKQVREAGPVAHQHNATLKPSCRPHRTYRPWLMGSSCRWCHPPHHAAHFIPLLRNGSKRHCAASGRGGAAEAGAEGRSKAGEVVQHHQHQARSQLETPHMQPGDQTLAVPRLADALGQAKGGVRAMRHATQCWYMWRQWARKQALLKRNMQRAMAWYFSEYMLRRGFAAWRKWSQAEHRHSVERRNQQNLEAVKAEVHAEHAASIDSLKYASLLPTVACALRLLGRCCSCSDGRQCTCAEMGCAVPAGGSCRRPTRRCTGRPRSGASWRRT